MILSAIHITRSVSTSSGRTTYTTGASCSGVGWSSLPSCSWGGRGLSTKKNLVLSPFNWLLHLDFLPLPILFKEDVCLTVYVFPETSRSPSGVSLERSPFPFESVSIDRNDHRPFRLLTVPSIGLVGLVQCGFFGVWDQELTFRVFPAEGLWAQTNEAASLPTSPTGTNKAP